jgi:hypothetical protein
MNSFSPENADERYVEMKGDLSVVPQGLYCYSRTTIIEGGVKTEPCPYWGSNPEKGDQNHGYCAHLKAGDWEEDGPFLLWDMVKECGINIGDLEEEVA